MLICRKHSHISGERPCHSVVLPIMDHSSSLQNQSHCRWLSARRLQSERATLTMACARLQLRASLLAFDALTTVALAVERAAACNNSTGGCAAAVEDVLSLRGADSSSLSAVAAGQVCS